LEALTECSSEIKNTSISTFSKRPTAKISTKARGVPPIAPISLSSNLSTVVPPGSFMHFQLSTQARKNEQAEVISYMYYHYIPFRKKQKRSFRARKRKKESKMYRYLNFVCVSMKTKLKGKKERRNELVL